MEPPLPPSPPSGPPYSMNFSLLKLGEPSPPFPALKCFLNLKLWSVHRFESPTTIIFPPSPPSPPSGPPLGTYFSRLRWVEPLPPLPDLTERNYFYIDRASLELKTFGYIYNSHFCEIIDDAFTEAKGAHARLLAQYLEDQAKLKSEWKL